MPTTIEKLSLQLIIPDPNNPRQSFDQEKLQELAASIQSIGQEQPISVRPRGDRFVIIQGHRRFHAHQLIHAETIDAIVRDDISEKDAALRQIVENLQRADLSPIEEAKGFPDCVLPVVPALIKPIRLALATHDPDIVVAGLNALQKVVLSNYGVGEAMVPFYRQLLQPMNLFYTKRQNIGDQIFYGQRKGTDLGTAVLETLELLEKTGGPNAFVNIKSYVPVYESCMQ